MKCLAETLKPDFSKRKDASKVKDEIVIAESEQMSLALERFFAKTFYREWYDYSSSALECSKQYVNDKFVLIRREISRPNAEVCFVSKRKGVFAIGIFTVHGLSAELWETAAIFLFHPFDIKKSLRISKVCTKRHVGEMCNSSVVT